MVKKHTADSDPRTLAVVYGQTCEICIGLIIKLIPKHPDADAIQYRRALIALLASPEDIELASIYVGLTPAQYGKAMGHLIQDGIVDDRHGHGRFSVNWLAISKATNGGSNGKETKRSGDGDGTARPEHKDPKAQR